MEQHLIDPAPYSFGMVLSGYLMVLPFWALGTLWNRARPQHSINPWILPTLASLFLGACFLITYLNHQWRDDSPMVIVALLPAALGCPLSALRWRRPEADESISDIHR